MQHSSAQTPGAPVSITEPSLVVCVWGMWDEGAFDQAQGKEMLWGPRMVDLGWHSSSSEPCVWAGLGASRNRIPRESGLWYCEMR